MRRATVPVTNFVIGSSTGRDVSSRVQLTREKKAELELDFGKSHELELGKLEEKCW